MQFSDIWYSDWYQVLWANYCFYPFYKVQIYISSLSSKVQIYILILQGFSFVKGSSSLLCIFGYFKFHRVQWQHSTGVIAYKTSSFILIQWYMIYGSISSRGFYQENHFRCIPYQNNPFSFARKWSLFYVKWGNGPYRPSACEKHNSCHLPPPFPKPNTMRKTQMHSSTPDTQINELICMPAFNQNLEGHPSLYSFKWWTTKDLWCLKTISIIWMDTLHKTAFEPNPGRKTTTLS